MNAANDHMSEGVDPQAVSCDPPYDKESQQILPIMGHMRREHVPVLALWKWLTDRLN